MRVFVKQEDPKSIILIPDLSGDFSRMFSGFRSQWMIFCSFRYFSA